MTSITVSVYGFYPYRTFANPIIVRAPFMATDEVCAVVVVVLIVAAVAVLCIFQSQLKGNILRS